MNFKDHYVMLDIETLSQNDDAIVTQIAAGLFLRGGCDDPDESADDEDNKFARLNLLDEVHYYLPLTPQSELGRGITGETLFWLLQMPDGVKALNKNLTGSQNDLKLILKGIVTRFDRWLTEHKELDWVAKSPQFDVTIIESLLRDVGIDWEIPFRSVVDYRTLCRTIAIPTLPRRPEYGAAHTARADVLHQAEDYENRLRHRWARP